jgi:hypothetical protein
MFATTEFSGHQSEKTLGKVFYTCVPIIVWKPVFVQTIYGQVVPIWQQTNTWLIQRYYPEQNQVQNQVQVLGPFEKMEKIAVKISEKLALMCGICKKNYRHQVDANRWAWLRDDQVNLQMFEKQSHKPKHPWVSECDLQHPICENCDRIVVELYDLWQEFCRLHKSQIHQLKHKIKLTSNILPELGYIIGGVENMCFCSCGDGYRFFQNDIRVDFCEGWEYHDSIPLRLLLEKSD